MQLFPTPFGLVSLKELALVTGDSMYVTEYLCYFLLCVHRKQLSEYLPPSVLKQKKKSSIIPPVSYKPYLEVNFL